jgi:hypothetical protein
MAVEMIVRANVKDDDEWKAGLDNALLARLGRRPSPPSPT